MKKVFHKIMSISMAFVVLFSTMSFTIDMHYCGDNMVDYSFFHNVESCGMEKAQLASKCENPKMSKNSCCSDEQIILEGQDDLKNNFSTLTFEQQVFVASFVYSYINLFEGTTSKEVPFIDYSPQFVKRDVQVLHQTFLI
ncbi:HYC_CC_PP family protein [Cellulophaga baltica]|uniref:HYC_CC_PP family protein n=1 Tax=Cellulophaga baltica TaxID=76594 RepID=UPI003F7185EB